MKLLYNTTTETTQPYPRADEAAVIGLDPLYVPVDVIDDPAPEYDPATQLIEQTVAVDLAVGTLTRGWTVRNLNAEEIAANLAAARAAKLAEIASSCRAEYESPLVTSYGAIFWTTAEAILDVMNIIAALPTPETVFEGYKGADDIWRDITREQFQLALHEGGVRKAAAFAKRKSLTDQIEDATTLTELAAISW